MKVTDEWLYEKMPIVDAAMVRQLEVCTQKKYVFSDKFRKRMKRLIAQNESTDEAADTERKVYVCRKTVEENHTENCGSSGCDACGSTHRHDECGGLPGTVFSYNKNGAGW